MKKRNRFIISQINIKFCGEILNSPQQKTNRIKLFFPTDSDKFSFACDMMSVILLKVSTFKFI